MTAGPNQLAPGSAIGRYRIVAPLQEGGMATVHLARIEGPREPGVAELCALKVMRPHLARDPAYVAMFEDEARLIWRLGRSGHPALLRIHELTRTPAGVPLLSMEYVEGVSLAQLMLFLVRTGRAMAPALAAHIVLSIARALHVAHELRGDRGEPLEVIHRDVSPQNVLLSTTGDVKLIDFGVAKARGRQWETAQGSLKGKLGYMSPEQARAEAIDRRTDVYALGVVLWESLVGQRLFHGEPDALLAKLQSPSVVPPRTLVPTLPEALDAVVMRALAVRAHDRFPTAAALESGLLSAMPDLSRPGSPLPRVLGQLVCAALAREVDDDVEEDRRRGRATIREFAAPRISEPGIESALALHTREAPRLEAPRPSLPPATRVVVPRVATPPRWGLIAAIGGASVVVLLASGLGVWVLLDRTLGGASTGASAASSAPVAAAPGSVPAAPPPPVAGPVPATTSSVVTANGALGESAGSAPVPLEEPMAVGVDPPDEPLDLDREASTSHDTHGTGRRHHREPPAALPPPWSPPLNGGEVRGAPAVPERRPVDPGAPRRVDPRANNGRY